MLECMEFQSVPGSKWCPSQEKLKILSGTESYVSEYIVQCDAIRWEQLEIFAQVIFLLPYLPILSYKSFPYFFSKKINTRIKFPIFGHPVRNSRRTHLTQSFEKNEKRKKTFEN